MSRQLLSRVTASWELIRLAAVQGHVTEEIMRSRFWRRSIVLLIFTVTVVWSRTTGAQSTRGTSGDFSNNMHPLTQVPKGVILVKGAWSSSSDSLTPVPEGGAVRGNVYSNPYFGFAYVLPKDWTEKYKGPPPSDTGRYVLTQIRPEDTHKRESRGNILITAQDMFFTSIPAKNVMELAAYEKNNLQHDYRLELPITQTNIAGRPFTFFAYWSPVAQLHWYVLATEVRCHAVEFVFTSQDTKVLEGLVLEMNKMQMPAEANRGNGSANVSPVCINDYAYSKNLITRVDPIFTVHRFNPVPVRIIIDKNGRVKHIHFLSAFPDQAKAVTDACKQWRFRPYVKDGQPIEVETGIMFGRASAATSQAGNATVD